MNRSERETRYRNWISYRHLTAAMKARLMWNAVRRGDTIADIAFRYGVSESRVYQLLTTIGKGAKQREAGRRVGA
jgi:hypothetical protein